MADPNQPHPQFGQTFPQVRPPLPNQGVHNYPAGQVPTVQGLVILHKFIIYVQKHFLEVELLSHQ